MRQRHRVDSSREHTSCGHQVHQQRKWAGAASTVENVVRARAALIMVKKMYAVSMKEVGCSTAVCMESR